MKKLFCDKCKSKGKIGRMKLRQQRPYDPSSWAKTKKKKRARWAKIKKSPLYKVIYSCGCGNRRIFVEKSRSEVFEKVGKELKDK